MTTTIRRGIAPVTWITMLVVLIIDLASKEWALNRLSGGRTIDVLWTLRFNLHFNTGIAFSQLTGFGEFVGVVAIVVAGVALALGRHVHHEGELLHGLRRHDFVGVVQHFCDGVAHLWNRNVHGFYKPVIKGV